MDFLHEEQGFLLAVMTEGRTQAQSSGFPWRAKGLHWGHESTGLVVHALWGVEGYESLDFLDLGGGHSPW